MNRHDVPALVGIGVGAVVSGALTLTLFTGPAEVASPRKSMGTPAPFEVFDPSHDVDFAVIRVAPGWQRGVRMSGPESPATGWHRERHPSRHGGHR